MLEVARTPDRRMVREPRKSRFRRVQEALGSFHVLLRDPDGLVHQVLAGPGPYEDAPGHA